MKKILGDLTLDKPVRVFRMYKGKTWVVLVIVSLLCVVSGCVFLEKKVSSAKTEKLLTPRKPKDTFVAYPDIDWKPKAFVFQKGNAIRYIDFKNGNDSNPGSKSLPWKHHPWDEYATGNAKSCKGVYTYIFKRGVTYYGALRAKDSGIAKESIQLTSDPNWGNGEAVLSGSEPFKGGWKQCSPKDAPDIPATAQTKTWYRDLDKSYVPRLLWEVHGNKVIPIRLARMPNWNVDSPDDPRSQWWELTGKIMELKVEVDSTEGFAKGDMITGTGKWLDLDENRNNITRSNTRVVDIGPNYLLIESSAWRNGEIKPRATITNGRAKAKVKNMSGTHQVIRRLVDNKHLTQSDPKFYEGAIMRSECGGHHTKIEKVISYDPKEHSLRINFHLHAGSGPRTFDRYSLAGLPQFLDIPGEFCYVENGKYAGRLYLRLPEDRNPNTTTIEVAKNDILIYIHNQNYIDISGLQLRTNNMIEISQRGRHAPLHAALILLCGSCQHIDIHNCRINNGSVGIIATPEKKDDVLDWINITDNDFRNIDGSAAALWNGLGHYQMKKYGARLKHVNILRNRVFNTGYLSRAHWGLGGIESLSIQGGEVVEVAYNHVDQVWGPGIFVFTGTDYNSGKLKRPFLRSKIHHNKVTNSLLGIQDFGGIAAWMGGPSYVYNNISGNAVGYKHEGYRRSFQKEGLRDWYRTSSYGVGIYLDGQYKGYVFNNLCWGKNNDVNTPMYASCAFNEAMGFLNTVFNNTFYNFAVGLHKGMTQHNRCYYMGNLMLHIGHKFIQQEPTQQGIEHNSLAWTKNIFHGSPPNFGMLGNETFPTLQDWQKSMRGKKALVAEAGTLAKGEQVNNAKAHDFRLRSDSSAIDNGAKVFVPWALYGVVGEWNFFKHPADPTVILGESINMNDEWFVRSMYQDIPRADLSGIGIGLDSFVDGTLENWTQGALALNGKDQFCQLKHTDLIASYKWGPTRTGHSGSYDGKNRKTIDMDTNNFLIETVVRTFPGHTGGGIAGKTDKNGYALTINEKGMVQLTLKAGQHEQVCASKNAINDGKWHHILAEIDRVKGRVKLYIDGKLANTETLNKITPDMSLSNIGNFLVGKTNKDNYFSGAIDFLRICRGTLAQAETTIQELHKWEFHGPFLKDMAGRTPTGNSRDAGALEYLFSK